MAQRMTLDAARENVQSARRGLELRARSEGDLRASLQALQEVVLTFRHAWVSQPPDSPQRDGLEFLSAIAATDVDPDNLEAACQLLSVEADRVLEVCELLEQRERELRFRKPLQPIALGVLVILLGVAVVTLAQRRAEPIDLADGKPWSASSSWADCTPRIGRCGGLVSRILFHTRDDDSPWFRIDLLSPRTFSGLTVVNRADEYADRAVPLIAEVSDDAQTWREVARRDSLFMTWRASFEPVTARYVQLRIGRKSWLHLEAVKVHP